MLNFKANQKGNRPLKILCLGAHCDDIEIGCGGTILKMLNRYKGSEVHWIVFSSDSRREEEARDSASLFLNNAGKSTIEINNFRNGYFPYIGAEIKDYFEGLKRRVAPDIIFTHYRNDLHQDHRILSELTWNTFRNHPILEYEIPKYDGDLGSPNLFVPLRKNACKQKVKYIVSSFKTQREKHWLTEDLMFSILRIRGMECVSPTKYAEAFYARKIVIT